MSRRVYTDEQREEALRLYADDGLAAAHNATGIPEADDPVVGEAVRRSDFRNPKHARRE